MAWKIGGIELSCGVRVFCNIDKIWYSIGMALCVIAIFIFCLYWLCKLGKVGKVVAGVILLLVIHIWCTNNLTWYPPQVAMPRIAISIGNGCSFKDAAVPTLGEQVVEDADGNYSVILNDHRRYADQYDCTPDIRVEMTPKNATLDKAEAQLTIKRENSGEEEVVVRNWFSYTIDGSKLYNNEHADLEPTVYTITAKNAVGQVSKTLTITRYPLYYVCGLYDETHPGHSAIEEISLCRERHEYDIKEEQSAGSGNISGSASSRPSASSGCVHYEYGSCWDELEDRAYDDGRFDSVYGNWGGAYNPPDDCTGVCLDIYEDAYYEGYGDY